MKRTPKPPIQRATVSAQPAISLQAEVAGASADLEVVAAGVAANPQLLAEVFAGLGVEEARVKYGCLRLLRLLSEDYPSALYPEIDRLIDLLDCESQVIQWGAIIMLGNLAAVDSQNKLKEILDRYLQPISGPAMITAANVVGGAAKIAQAKPALADKIAAAILKVESAGYRTEECRNVVLGHAVEALDRIFEYLSRPQQVLALVNRQLQNPRSAVRKKAARFLNKHGQSAV